MTRCVPSALLVLLILLSSAVARAQVTAVLHPSKDNTLYFDPSGGLSNGAGPTLFAGVTAIGDSRRAVLAFDVAGAIPAGSTIVSAQLTMTVNMTISGSVAMFLHALQADWGEGRSDTGPSGGGAGMPATAGDATWIHTFFPGSVWTPAGGDFVSAPSASTSVGGAGAWSWTGGQMVADVQGWLDTPSTNYGWLMKSDELSVFTTKRFASREEPDISIRPTLVVTFMASTAAATVTSGTGCAIAANAPPFTLGTTSPPSINNPSFGLTIVNGPPGGQAFLYIAGSVVAPISIGPGGSCGIYLELTTALAFIGAGISPIGPLPLNPSGNQTLPIPLPNDPGLSGQELSVQALGTDGSTLVTSNALTLLFQ
jgi:hypothetical protein